ncbi:hypothetical protein ACPV51_22635, partial [Vibrio astriarenae]
SPVIQTTRKHQVLSIGKTRKRLNQRVGQCSLVTQTGASELGYKVRVSSLDPKTAPSLVKLSSLSIQ